MPIRLSTLFDDKTHVPVSIFIQAGAYANGHALLSSPVVTPCFTISVSSFIGYFSGRGNENAGGGMRLEAIIGDVRFQ